jgi:hypothetical protein
MLTCLQHRNGAHVLTCGPYAWLGGKSRVFDRTADALAAIVDAEGGRIGER